MAIKERSMSKLEGLSLQQCNDANGQLYRANIDKGKSYTLKHFLKIGEPMATIYQACVSMERNNTTKRKPGNGRPAVKMAKRKKTRLIKAGYDKKGVTSGKLLRKWMLTGLI